AAQMAPRSAARERSWSSRIATRQRRPRAMLRRLASQMPDVGRERDQQLRSSGAVGLPTRPAAGGWAAYCGSSPASEERVVQREADGVQVLRRRREAVVDELEDLLAPLVVTVLESADEPLPDLVLERAGHLPEGGPRARGLGRRAHALGVIEVLQPQGGAELLRPVVRGVRRDPPPGRVRVVPRP